MLNLNTTAVDMAKDIAGLLRKKGWLLTAVTGDDAMLHMEMTPATTDVFAVNTNQTVADFDEEMDRQLVLSRPDRFEQE